MKNTLIDEIDSLLPQTQCGLCGYGACRPYAQAIAESNELINRCPPGGVKTLLSLSALLNQDPSPYLAEVSSKAKPSSIAVIREDDCIGCTKCIQACPVDAILGAAKKMHTILLEECTGCELCIAPCPVDCIDLIFLEPREHALQAQKANQWRVRYQNRNNRIGQVDSVAKKETQNNIVDNSIIRRKTAISEALERVKAKKESANESKETL